MDQEFPTAVNAALMNPESSEEREIKGLIDAFNAKHVTNLGQDLFTPTTELLKR